MRARANQDLVEGKVKMLTVRVPSVWQRNATGTQVWRRCETHDLFLLGDGDTGC